MGAVVIIVIILISFSGSRAEVKTVAVERGTVIAEVSVTGQVKPATSIDLAFERSGRIARIPVSVGGRVTQGAELIVMENGDAVAQLQQARAALATQQAKLDEYVRGSRPEELSSAQLDLQKAQSNLENYYQAGVNVLTDAYNKADDAVRKQVVALFIDQNPDRGDYSFYSSDTDAKVLGITYRRQAYNELNAWSAELSTMQATEASIASGFTHARAWLATVSLLMDTLMDVIEGSSALDATTRATYKTNIATARTNVNTALASITTQEQTIAAQKIEVDKERKALALVQEGVRPEQVDAQRAQVESARGQVNYYASLVEKTILRAPFSGIVTRIVPKLGEIATANASAVSLIGEGAYEIETKITESDVAKIKVGDKARVTLDAYGSGVVFEALVTEIDISETVIEGVPTYTTTLQFTANDERIRSGFTANVDIMAGKKENVLFVPTRAIMVDNGTRSVTVQEGDEAREVKIEIGLRGSDGRTEVTGGLAEGDHVVTE